jgi:DNA ligase-1
VTGALLRVIHGVNPELIIEHHLGETWEHAYDNNQQTEMDSATSTSRTQQSQKYAQITFYDANHCPGAVLVFVHFPFTGKSYLHTGDMRYHPKFCEYDLLKEAVLSRTLDTVYLDTTYSHPRHDFPLQDVTVNNVANKVEEVLRANKDIECNKKSNFFQPNTIQTASCEKATKKTLVLISCYSIGKEKVLWKASMQSNQSVYVNKKKHKMLQCIEASRETERSCGIISRCTQDPKDSDLHVIRMGTAGSLFPYFQPNFIECAKYARRWDKGYTRVVAFLPTGWANTSKSTGAVKEVNLDDINDRSKRGNDSTIQVEIYPVPYSEHSSYSELRSFVKFLKPRKLIPTVFSSEKEFLNIQGRFKDLIDSQRAKMEFINSFTSPKEIKRSGDKAHAMSSPSINIGEGKVHDTKAKRKRSVNTDDNDWKKQREADNNITEGKSQDSNEQKSKREQKHASEMKETRKGQTQDIGDKQNGFVDDEKVAQLVDMGFDIARVRQGLLVNKSCLNSTMEWLLK